MLMVMLVCASPTRHSYTPLCSTPMLLIVRLLVPTVPAGVLTKVGVSRGMLRVFSLHTMGLLKSGEVQVRSTVTPSMMSTSMSYSLCV